MAAQQLLQLGDEHLLVFVADWAQPLVAGQHVVLPAALAHPHIAAPATRTQSEHYTTLSLPLCPLIGLPCAPVPADGAPVDDAPQLRLAPPAAPGGVRRPLAADPAPRPAPAPGGHLDHASAAQRRQLRAQSAENMRLLKIFCESFSWLTLTPPTQYPDRPDWLCSPGMVQ